ncbi:hypothetical protein [Halorussus sp. MSC15.2]|uniref:hypothetical protein n=1 Tax=Halorussus sp. MSC15.2 TaxID=2283638 RepID=UPI0013D0465B|nr:hypothetical protein [Halorussus sp. MSC15.2]NEU56279.1 hypothetical protein [Halorussus sp. MSC15.2]
MDHYSESPRKLSRLRLKIGDLEEKWQEMNEEWDDWGNIQSVEDDLFPLIISTHAAIEDITTHLILAYVVKDEVAEGAFEYIYSGMSQSHREELLVKCNILSNETRGKISRFKGLRNKVAHGTFQQLDWYRDEIPEKMDIAFEVLDSFEKAFTDRDLIDAIEEGEETL